MGGVKRERGQALRPVHHPLPIFRSSLAALSVQASTAMSFRLFPLLLTVFLLAGCGEPDDRIVPPTPGVAQEAVPDQRRALNTALDTLAALVATLERVGSPIDAWNRAPEVARLLAELERTRGDYALDMDESEAARRYPAEIDRLKRLEAQRDIEMDRIMENRAIGQVLLEEISKAEAATD